ncbi:class I tRNA ligase family protein, partial [Halomonas sp.]|uniref:class I tRNA ligase family protein n=1 Tax=Halomonas sp. TaxID=1486246 RepID=UPI0025BBBFD4
MVPQSPQHQVTGSELPVAEGAERYRVAGLFQEGRAIQCQPHLQGAAEQVAGQSADFQRLGVLADWDHPYLTMDFRIEADIIRAFGRIM